MGASRALRRRRVPAAPRVPITGRMSFEPGPTFSFADQPAAEGRATTRALGLLELLPAREPGGLDELMAADDPDARSCAPREPAPSVPSNQ